MGALWLANLSQNQRIMYDCVAAYILLFIFYLTLEIIGLQKIDQHFETTNIPYGSLVYLCGEVVVFEAAK
jgi:hypothetical protein